MPRTNTPNRISDKSLATQSRHYGYIQAETPTDDGQGGETQAWSNTHTDPHCFSVSALSARQVMEYKSINVEASHLIKIHGEIPVSETNRIVVETLNNKTFEVLTVEDIQERGIMKVIMCKERRA